MKANENLKFCHDMLWIEIVAVFHRKYHYKRFLKPSCLWGGDHGVPVRKIRQFISVRCRQMRSLIASIKSIRIYLLIPSFDRIHRLSIVW